MSMAENNGESGENLTQYQFTIDADLWYDWKDTVPRSKKLDDRIRELVKNDLERQKAK